MTTRILSLSLATALLAACGSSPTTEPRAEQPEPAPVDQVASVSEPDVDPAPKVDSLDEAPAVPPLEDEPDAGELMTPPVEPPPPAQEDPDVPADEDEPVEEPTPKAAELGRPDWWFDGVRRGDGRVALCAEAGGETVREARRAAIALARRKLDRELGEQTEREAVSMAMVLPLPAADAPGAARYIGYVMMEARLR
jgi:type IV secretory pathway VirB10-like protein